MSKERLLVLEQSYFSVLLYIVAENYAIDHGSCSWDLFKKFIMILHEHCTMTEAVLSE